ncbi:MAG: HEPN family nuclease [Phycisphaerae bacterium]
MTPRYPVREMMRRTMRNLQFLQDRATLKGPYATTQLINSFLCALVHIKEKYDRHIPQTILPVPGWNVITTSPFIAPKTIRALVVLLRHAVAHGNVEMLPDSGQRNGEVAFIRLWNVPPSTNKKNWEATISVQDLGTLLDSFVELMTPILRQHEQSVR